MPCRRIVPSGIAAGLTEITHIEHSPYMRTISQYPLPDHCSAHLSHIAVTYSIIDFQRIFLLLIGGDCSPRCGSEPPIANFTNMPMATYASMGLAVSTFQRSTSTRCVKGSTQRPPVRILIAASRFSPARPSPVSEARVSTLRQPAPEST